MKKKNATEPDPRISPYWAQIQKSLFGLAEEYVEELTPAHQQVLMALEVIRIEEFVQSRRRWRGRPPVSRKALARAFVARAVLNIPGVDDLAERLRLDIKLRRICGFNGAAPSESTLCRAFAVFCEDESIREKVLEHQVRVHLCQVVIPHLSTDSSAIDAREEPVLNPKKEPQEKKKRGRKKGIAPKPKEPTRLEKQLGQSWEEAVAELPRVCNIGSKLNSSGHMCHWKGYKLHVSVADGGIPISVCLTSASVHDTQVAIPLMKMNASRTFASLYDLMDRGYDAKLLRDFSEKLGHVPLVQRKARAGEPAVPFDPAQDKRFENRTVVERFFSDLKDNHCGRNIRVKGWKKILMHLMFGILAIFASTVLRV